MRNVCILTPAYDCSVDAYYHHSVIDAIKECMRRNINVLPLTWPGEALVQHGRNALVELGLKTNADAFVWIDADQEFTAKQFIALLTHDVDVVGGTYRKKTDADEQYTVRVCSQEVVSENGLWKVDGLGTGFLKVSRKSLQAVYDQSEEYENNGNQFRAVFDVKIIDGRLYGEDTIFCETLQSAGYDVWLDPSLTVGHNGYKRYKGDFRAFAERLQQKETASVV